MNHFELALDVLLIAGLIGLALQSISGPTIFRSMVMFITFSFSMALAWVRLGAPDLALAEASIGAGITGALMMIAYQRLSGSTDSGSRDQAPPVSRSRVFLSAIVAILASGLVVVIGWSALGLGAETRIAGEIAVASTNEANITNPVTAVLIVFRNFDTLLEVTVLLVAFLGVRAIATAELEKITAPSIVDITLIANLRAIVVPLTLLVAGYLLHSGTMGPGGAFQAGALLAAGAVLLILSGQMIPYAGSDLPVRVGMVLATAVLVITGYATHWWGSGMLVIPGVWSIYLIEMAMTISVALILTLLFVGSPGLRWRSK